MILHKGDSREDKGFRDFFNPDSDSPLKDHSLVHSIDNVTIEGNQGYGCGETSEGVRDWRCETSEGVRDRILGCAVVNGCGCAMAGGCG